MPLTLTPQQQEALGALDWLVSPQRRSGKTTVLAIAIVRAACKNPGQWISIIDHEPGVRMSEYMVEQVRGLLRSDARLVNHTLQRGRLRIDLTAPFEWMPWSPEDSAPPTLVPLPPVQSPSPLLVSKWTHLGEL